MRNGTLLAYFNKKNEARRAVKILKQKGHNRIAWIHKDDKGKMRTHDPFPGRRIFGLFSFAVIFSSVAIIALSQVQASHYLHWGLSFVLLCLGCSGVLGALLSLVVVRRKYFGVEKQLLRDQARWLSDDETVLILQAPIEKLKNPSTILLKGVQVPPTIFILHPQRDCPFVCERSSAIPLTEEQLREQAQRLSAAHHLASRRIRDTRLLKQLKESRSWVTLVCHDLTEAARLEQTVPPVAEWLLDNEYILESHTRDVQINLPRQQYQRLPALDNEAFKGLPRVYALAREFVAYTDFRLDEDNIQAFFEAYQTEKPLSIVELWTLPQMLRVAIIEGIRDLSERALTKLREGEMADFWAHRLMAACRRDSKQLFSILAELTETHTRPSLNFGSQLIDCLYDEGAVLTPVQNWLESTFNKSFAELSLREKNHEIKDQVSIGNAFTSLRQLAVLDWKDLFERLSVVEKILRQDPAGIYPHMDFPTRDRYRRSVEELHRGSVLSEVGVAEKVVEQAALAQKASAEDDRLAHVGSYLMAGQRPLFARLIGAKEKMRYRLLHSTYRHHLGVYFIGVGVVFSLLFGLLLSLGFGVFSLPLQILLTTLLVLPVSQLSLDVVHYAITRLFPPRALPKMDYRETGVPDVCQTLVVVPMMLVNPGTIQAEADKLEVRFLANREKNLFYGLLSDYLDADTEKTETDSAYLQTAVQVVEVLNQKYGAGQFFLFHRNRKWCASERKFIGWERKRGKLEELNDFLTGARPHDAEQFVFVGDPQRLQNVRFVITLDSDTQLPHDAARRMIETISHPLNQPRFDSDGRVLKGTYSLIQPRVTPSLPNASRSPFSRLFSNPVGVDPYTNAVSDVYQDLVGEGSYHGKGIYAVRALSRVLTKRFPDGHILSHDLIEGAHVRVALASDIELYDDFPQDYLSFVKRQHRWVRGDWQIIDWILPRVPDHNRKRVKNPLGTFDRWKVFDNLRRSALPIGNFGLLLLGGSLSRQALSWASLVIVSQFLFHSLAQHFTWATTRQGLKSVSLSKIAQDLLRVVVETALLPFQAWMNLDAIARSLYRRFISHQHMLEWTTAQMMERRAKTKQLGFLVSVGSTSALSLGLVALLTIFRSGLLFWASPWLGVWFISPLVAWALNRQPQIPLPLSLVADDERRFLRLVSRKTWRYFSDFVNEKTSWLPPDNYQVSHQNKVAMRSSPTNIGLWMVSVVGAHHFGYLTMDDVVQRLNKTFETLLKLERYEGHLLNWYDIQTLSPLHPKYVSTVDSGNFLGSLWTLRHALEDLVHQPLLEKKAFEGLRDASEILHEYTFNQTYVGFEVDDLNQLLRIWETPPANLAERVVVLWQTKVMAENLAQKTLGLAATQGNVAYWAEQIFLQLKSWLSIADRYFSWMTLLQEKTDEELRGFGETFVQQRTQALQKAPSLFDLAHGNVEVVSLLESLRSQVSDQTTTLTEWSDRVLEAFSRSKWLAGEILGQVDQLIRCCEQLSQAINLRFLYNPQRKLFSIGYNVSEGHLDRSFYDLLASEARLGSFIAIARGEIPVEHWFDMTRPYGAVGRKRVLLSWTGTMFEYLMPLLFQRSYWNTLLDKAVREAVEIQMQYAKKCGVPWGISESAFGDLDIHKTYQYYAFGVPSLGLKRGQEEKVVIAPYASLLALSLRPKDTLKNLKRLATLGLLSDHGYFEAIDFSRQQKRSGARGVIVRAYMAHHQGMAFLSLTNFLHNNPLQRYFHTDQRVRTAEPLLYERIPVLPTVHHISTRERVSSVAQVGETPQTISQFETPHTQIPKTQLLSNGRYALMVTNAGGGYSRWNDFDITRWRSDVTRDARGTFCYLHDLDSHVLWSNTYHPTGGKAEKYQATFTLDRAVFQRIEHGIETETEIIVAPEDDVEIRRVTMINRSAKMRRLNLTSYVELAMAPHAADRQHPAFNKLFIQTEAVHDHRAILASRRTRHDNEQPFYVAHSLTLERDDGEPLFFETDRRQFVGRGRSLANPMGAMQNLNNSKGFVLDPILSLRKTVILAPEQRIQISLVMAAADSRAKVLNSMSKYSSPHAVDHAMDLVWAAAQVEQRLLRIHSDEARRFQQLASHLLYPNPLLRSPAKRIAENRKGQSALWAYGISGDLPIVLVVIEEAYDLGLVRQLLQAHNYWRMHGLKADLVIINEESNSYEQPLREKLERLIQVHATSTGTEQPGGVFLRSASLIPKEDLLLMQAVAHVVMIAARGSLPQQMGVATETPDLPKLIARKQSSRDYSAALPFMELNYFNSLGGFTQDGREYAIYLGPDLNTPAPWVNVMANPSFGSMVSETGAGFTWCGNSQRNRLTTWSNDPVTDPPSEMIYIRDEETGIYWTPTAAPVRERTAYRARHGTGYTVFEHNSQGIKQELTVLVPMNDEGGEPVKLQRLELVNDSGRQRKISITLYAEWVLGETRETSQMHIVSSWDDDLKILTAHNRYHPDDAERVTFAAFNVPASSYTADRAIFVGRNRSLRHPLAMERVRLSQRVGAALDPCAALQVIVKLAPGEKTEVICLLGQGGSVEQVQKMVQKYRKKRSFDVALSQTKGWWDRRLNTVQVTTPELSTNLLINRWLLYQTLSCRIWGRSAFYQSGGAFGFRDQLQDAMALLYADPKLAREQILLAASRQFKEGDVQHWWHPPRGAGIRSRISDDLLWLPYVVAQYFEVTNDESLLNENVSFLEAPELEENQHELFLMPEVSRERATIFEHCQRAVARAQKYGEHGLPLMGTGDWNDGMNTVGIEGRGESVWLAWFMVDVLKCMSEMAERLKKTDLAKTYLGDRQTLIQNIENFAWDGAWYLRATFDDGSLLGSHENTEAKIDSLPQSWASLTGAAQKERAEQALASAWQHLVKEEEGLVLLFTPPFDESRPSPGYIRGYPPGVRENGGQYTHAALWLAMAFARAGQGDRAAKILRLINPIEHAREPESVWRYNVEPYVVAADVYQLKERLSMGGWSWYTGSASWMYRVWVEECLGLKVRGQTVQINPVIPKEWDGFSMTYQHGEALYEIQVENPEHCETGVLWIELNGHRVKTNRIALDREPVKHKVIVRMGTEENPLLLEPHSLPKASTTSLN